MAKEMLSSCQWGLSHWDFTESIIGTQQSITHTKHRKLNMRPSRAANLNIAATKLLHQLDRAYHRLLKFRSSTFRLTLFLNPRDLNMPSRGLSHKNLHAASTTVYRLDLQHQKWLVLKSRNQFDPILILQTHWLTIKAIGLCNQPDCHSKVRDRHFPAISPFLSLIRLVCWCETNWRLHELIWPWLLQQKSCLLADWFDRKLTIGLS